ncbi:hypothetical protein ACQP1G_16475 [Nocardia sp. CA-107356]|uniref:hypothetical protein n=1 Tax=Nocardia sp. CA-107356 TaxID=3239972 RepID=UPI003D8A6BC4
MSLREERFGEVPQLIFHEGNSIAHKLEFEADPRRRPLTNDEVQTLFDASDARPARIRNSGRKGTLSAARDAAVLKTVYAFGLRHSQASGQNLGLIPHGCQIRDDLRREYFHARTIRRHVRVCGIAEQVVHERFEERSRKFHARHRIRAMRKICPVEGRLCDLGFAVLAQSSKVETGPKMLCGQGLAGFDARNTHECNRFGDWNRNVLGLPIFRHGYTSIR